MNKDKVSILYKINHKPLLIGKIFEFSLQRPFILFQLIEKSKYLKDKIEELKISKKNDFTKEDNNIYSLFFDILKFNESFEEIMSKKIIIDKEEKSYFVTKPNINLLYEEILQELFNEFKIYLPKKASNFFAGALLEYCMNKPFISLSINLFTKENNSDFNFEFTEDDLDINYLKYINKKENTNATKNQRIKLCINIYNRYYNKEKIKGMNVKGYYTNIDLINNLKIKEIHFIRPSFYENYIIEKIFNKNGMIEELKIMFNFLKNIKYPEEITLVQFSDNIIKNISLMKNEVSTMLGLNLLNSNDKGISNSINDYLLFKNLKYIGVNANLMNMDIKRIMFNIFHYKLFFISYKDIMNNNIIKNYENNKESLFIEEGAIYINLERNIIYNNNFYRYLTQLFNPKNSSLINKINKLVIVYECDDSNMVINSNYNIDIDDMKNKYKYNCVLPNLKEIIFSNTTNKICDKAIIEPNKILDFISFLCLNSNNVTSLKINDTYLPFNILNVFENNDHFINNITNLEIKSSSLSNYNYNIIIEKINKCPNLKYILINTMNSNFNDSFGDIKVSSKLKDIKLFSFNDFFLYKNTEHKRIQFIQKSSIEKELVELFSEIIENENNLETLELKGFHYNFDGIKNMNVKLIKVNLEKSEKDYKINQNKFKKINMKLNNFQNLNKIEIYVDILYQVDDFIKMPIESKLKTVDLYVSVISCDINNLDKLLKENGVELIVRNIEIFNKSKELAYISSFPMVH